MKDTGQTSFKHDEMTRMKKKKYCDSRTNNAMVKYCNTLHISEYYNIKIRKHLRNFCSMQLQQRPPPLFAIQLNVERFNIVLLRSIVGS